MRPGLVAIGVVFLVLAAGGLVALFLIPIPTPTVTDTSSTSWTAGPHASNATEIFGPSYLEGAFEINWQSSLPLTIRVYTSTGCTPGVSGCPDWQLAQTFTGAPSGNWSTPGPLRFPFLVAWTNAGSVAGPVVLTTVTTQGGSVGLSPLSEILLGLGVGALGFVGGLAMFLGFFLRGGVYRGPPPLVSRGAEDVEEIATGRSSGGPRPPVH